MVRLKQEEPASDWLQVKTFSLGLAVVCASAFLAGIALLVLLAPTVR